MPFSTVFWSNLRILSNFKRKNREKFKQLQRLRSFSGCLQKKCTTCLESAYTDKLNHSNTDRQTERKTRAHTQTPIIYDSPHRQTEELTDMPDTYTHKQKQTVIQLNTLSYKLFITVSPIHITLQYTSCHCRLCKHVRTERERRRGGIAYVNKNDLRTAYLRT